MQLPVFDCHCDTISEAQLKGCGLRRNKLHLDLERGMKFSPYAQVFAIFTRPWVNDPDIKEVDYSKDYPYETLIGLCDGLLELLLEEFNKNRDILTLCRSPKEAIVAGKHGKIAAFIAVEGAELLGCDIKRLEQAYEKGVRLINLSWNYDNDLCGAANGLNKGGLTDAGKNFVKRMQELGIAVDLSHASEKTFWDVAEISKRPILAGHSNSKAICDNPRNLTDRQFSEIVRTRGAVGLNLSPAFLSESGEAGISDVIRHAEHFLELGGERTLCLGGDLDGIDNLPKDFLGIQSYDKLYEAMLCQNYPESLVRDIFYNNLMKVLEETL